MTNKEWNCFMDREIILKPYIKKSLDKVADNMFALADKLNKQLRGK